MEMALGCPSMRALEEAAQLVRVAPGRGVTEPFLIRHDAWRQKAIMTARIDLMHVTPDVLSGGQDSSTQQVREDGRTPLESDTTTADLPTVERDTIARVLQECRRLSRTQLYVRLRQYDLEQPRLAKHRGE
jgi:hypothetical protein